MECCEKLSGRNGTNSSREIQHQHCPHPDCSADGLTTYSTQESLDAHFHSTHLAKVTSLIRPVLGSLVQHTVTLTSLDISFARLGVWYYDGFPPAITSCTQLRVLAANRLPYELPEDLGMLTNLEELYLKGSSISHIPASVGQLRHLRILDIYPSHNCHWLPYQILQCPLEMWLELVGGTRQSISVL